MRQMCPPLVPARGLNVQVQYACRYPPWPDLSHAPEVGELSAAKLQTHCKQVCVLPRAQMRHGKVREG